MIKWSGWRIALDLNSRSYGGELISCCDYSSENRLLQLSRGEKKTALRRRFSVAGFGEAKACASLVDTLAYPEVMHV